MATFTQINDFLLDICYGRHDLTNAGGDTIELSLTNTAPASEVPDPTTTGNGILANITPISYTNYTDDLTVDRVLTAANKTSALSGGAGAGTFTFDYTADIVITASPGALATFRYIYLFNQTTVAPTDALIGVWDHGAGITLAATETATIQWNASGIFTIS